MTIRLTVTGADGIVHTLTGMAGESLMEVIRDAGAEGLLAMCGGCCSCATCHVTVTGGPVAALSAPLADENDLLLALPGGTPASRLSCQIRLEPALDGLCVTVMPTD
jgi:2Fe-2S ferredoxin